MYIRGFWFFLTGFVCNLKLKGLYAPFTHSTITYLTHYLGSIPEPWKPIGVEGTLTRLL